MNLVLFGSGEFTPAVDNIDKYLIDKYQPRNIAVLPTAAGTESDASKWIEMAKLHYAKYNLPVIAVPIFNKTQSNDKTLIDLLDQADWIFFSGGNPNYLLEVLTGSELWRVILKKLEVGTLISGSSAGAMIMGRFLLSPSFKPDHKGLWQDAFGLVDYTIIPHFDHFKRNRGFIRKLLQISPAKVRSSWIGIDENTAIIFGDHEPSVRGLGHVEIHDSKAILNLSQ
jgi:cyanophycinase